MKVYMLTRVDLGFRVVDTGEVLDLKAEAAQRLVDDGVAVFEANSPTLIPREETPKILDKDDPSIWVNPHPFVSPAAQAAAQECGAIFLEARGRYKTGYQMTPTIRLQERAIANIRNRVSQGQATIEDFRDAVKAWETLLKAQRGVKK